MILTEKYLHNIILQEINQTVTFTPNKYNVVTTFDKINKACFNGSLKLCKINFRLKKNYLGYFKYDGYGKNGELINPILSINGNYQYNINQFESVLAHEMIHYYLAKIGIDTKCSHGSEFKQMANSINSQFGLTISETIDTGNMQYGTSQNDPSLPSKQVLGKLRAYYDSIKSFHIQMEKDMKNKNGNIAFFIQTLYSFDISLMNAIKRCVSKNSLNESGEFTKAINDFRSGYNKWYNNTIDFLKNKNSNYNGFGGSGSNSVDGNLSLMELLFSVFPNEIEKKYEKINSKNMNALSSIPYINNLMAIIKSLASYVENSMQNAQGTNP